MLQDVWCSRHLEPKQLCPQNVSRLRCLDYIGFVKAACGSAHANIIFTKPSIYLFNHIHSSTQPGTQPSPNLLTHPSIEPLTPVDPSIHSTIHPHINPSIHLSTHQCIYPSTHPFIHTPIDLSIHLLTHPAKYSSTQLNIHPHINSPTHPLMYPTTH